MALAILPTCQLKVWFKGSMLCLLTQICWQATQKLGFEGLAYR
jgi:hypothetical protein